VAAGLIHYDTGIGKSSTRHQPKASVVSPASSATQSRPRYGFMGLGIAFGATPKQVLREIGSPTKEQANCWLYRGHVGSIRGRYSGPYVDAMKFCFSAAPTGGTVMTRIFSHYAAHTIAKEHFPGQWHPPATLMKVPDWYLHENS
jgi:hypothetical protein